MRRIADCSSEIHEPSGLIVRDLYEILGVGRTAPAEEMKKSYRELAKKWHPDRNPGNKQAEERFKEVSVAYDVLSDQKKKALYDEFGFDGLASGFDPKRARAWGREGRRGRAEAPFGGGAALDLDDLFGQLFGGGGGDFGAKLRRGPDYEAQVEIDLPDALRGGEVTLQKEGGGRVTARIPPYVEDGAVLRLRGQGGKGPRGAGAGDLLLHVHHRAHPHLRLEGGVAVLDVPVTVAEAVAGAKIDVPTVTGSVALKVPAGSQAGTRLRLRGKGGAGRDLIVNLLVRVPTGGGKAAEDAAHALDEHYAADVRRDLRI